jgi:hypothetical protein
VKRTLELAVLVAAVALPGAARPDGYLESGFRLSTLVSIGWDTVVPQQDLRDFVDRRTFRGCQFELGFGVARHFSLGLAGSWNWLSQGFPTGSLLLPDGAISGKAYRRVQLTELRGTAHWYLTNGPLQPYLGTALGGGRHETYVAVAEVVRTSSGWHAAAEPRAGLLWTVRPGLAVDLQARYVFTNARIGDARDARWLAIDLGLALY